MIYQLVFELRNCDKPRLIEALRSKRVRDISCGSSHSAAIISNGDLYTWGLGEYGRLGHGDNTTQLRPKQVMCKIDDYCQDVILLSIGKNHYFSKNQIPEKLNWCQNLNEFILFVFSGYIKILIKIQFKIKILHE